MLLVHDHHRRLQLLRIALVLGLNGLQLRLNALHRHRAAHRALIERPKQDAHDDAEEHQNPAIRQSQRGLHPQQQSDDHRRERLHNTLQPAAIRVRRFKLAAHGHQSRELLRTGVQFEGRFPGLERRDHRGLRTRRDLGGADTAGEIDFSKRRLPNRSQKTNKEILVLRDNPRDRTSGNLALPRIERAERDTLRVLHLGLVRIREVRSILDCVRFR